MAKSLPPLTWFRSFEAAARLLSSTAAAAEIGLTQSAVSQQIKALETRLGVALFRRHARGLSLTDEGRKLLPQVETALETLEGATARFVTEPDEATLTVAASVSILKWVIAPRITEFRARFPYIHLRFASTTWPDEYSALRADVEIRFGSAKQVGGAAMALKPDRLIVVKAPALTGGLEDAPLIESVGTSDDWAAWFSESGVPQRASMLRVDSYGVALDFAIEGAGIALVSRLVAASPLRLGLVEMAHTVSIPAKEGYFLSARGHPNATAFADWIVEHATTDFDIG